MNERLLREWIRESLIREGTVVSDQHETDIANAFLDQTMPASIPKFMTALGIKPGDKVIFSEAMGGSGGKTDIKVKFARDGKEIPGQLKISAKMESASFFSNWYTKERLEQELDPSLTQPCADAARDFAKGYNWAPAQDPETKKNIPAAGPRTKPYRDINAAVGIALSAATERTGKTGRTFKQLFGKNAEKYMLSVAAGNPPDANCLYASTNVPAFPDILSNCEPLNGETLSRYAETFSLVFRVLFTISTRENRPAWARLVVTNPPQKMTMCETTAELLKYCEWESANPPVDMEEIIADLADNNIAVPDKYSSKKILDPVTGKESVPTPARPLRRRPGRRRKSKDEALVRKIVRESILLEELTKADVEKIAKTQIEKDRAEQKRIIKKEIESELKSSLGTSFFGNPGKVRKAIEEIVQDELSRSFRRGGEMEAEVAEITKAVLKKMYREISHSYNPVIDRIRI